ncbi:transposase [Pannus brasiliensis CCIBt3594]|uniref:Transposase n=1 Tax=Pannus brasiliensis CCIBt3594 TaxID=1427578 RepID=A0AAW9QR38_9CHRO
MTILVTFHPNQTRNFQHYYLNHVCIYWRDAFPGLPGYQRFVEWIPSTLLPLRIYLKRCFGECTGIGFLDATRLVACQNRRISSHRMFEGLAARSSFSLNLVET